MATSHSAAAMYPLSPVHELKQAHVGHKLQDIHGPAAIVNRTLINKHCQTMLDVCAALDVDFRAHVKTHKTTEVAALQVGNSPRASARFIASTVAEIEHLIPLAEQLHAQGRTVSILYGIPPSITAIERLHTLAAASKVPAGTIAFLLDHPTQIAHLANLYHSHPIPVFLKTDSGYHRAGVSPDSSTLGALLTAATTTPGVHLAGLYAHHGLSYASDTPDDALDYLSIELEATLASLATARKAGVTHPLVLSIGTTPTAVAVYNLHNQHSSAAATRARALLQQAKDVATLEIHAGVYPILDMQQMATTARAGSAAVGTADISLSILAEVLSVYDERERPEALIGAGCIALGREPCKSYPGWGVVATAPWDHPAPRRTYEPDGAREGWIVGRVAQEHGILAWEGDAARCTPLAVGDKLLIWPNHACIASAPYGWYLVVDSDVDGGNEVVDVWARWRGW